MGCTLVFYLVTIFVVVHSSLPELCVFKDEINGGKSVLCGRNDVNYTFDFIPPVYQNIKDFRMSEHPLKRLPYNAFRNLSSQSSVSAITVIFCQISHVDAGALLNLHSLTSINLMYNDITQIDSKMFSDTRQITHIHMPYNKIEVVPNGIFQNLTRLEAVYLEQNLIHQVEMFSFKDTPSLRIIKLNNNRIEFMNMLFKDKFDNLTHLYLYGNPWKCDCELGPFYEFAIKLNELNLFDLLCEKPPKLLGRRWKDVRRDEFVCRSEDATSQDSGMTSIEPMTTAEHDDNIPVAVYSGTTLPSIVKRRSLRRTNARNMDSGLPMRVVQSSAVPENGDSALNTDDVDE